MQRFTGITTSITTRFTSITTDLQVLLQLGKVYQPYSFKTQLVVVNKIYLALEK